MSNSTYTEAEAWAEFLKVMASAGISTRDKIAPSSKLQRFNVEGQRNGTKNGWLVFYGDHPASGGFGDYKTGVQDTWTVEKPDRMSDEDREAIRVRMADAKRQRAEELATAHRLCREAAAAIVAALEPASPEHAYLKRKGLVATPGLKQLARDVRYTVADPEKPNRTARKGVLVIPIKGPDGTLHAVQTIDPDGRKHFLSGTNKAGHYNSIGKLTQRIIIGEGYSTAATIHMATGCCVVIAFDAGNLKAVARAIRAKYPTHEIVMGADNDRFTMKPVPNPGMTKACEAAAEVGGLVAWPEFESGVTLANGDLPTDFNDLAEIRANLESVAAAFEVAMRPADIENHVDPRHRVEAPRASAEPTPEPERLPEPNAEIPTSYEDAADDRQYSKSVVAHLCLGHEAGPLFYFKSEVSGLIITATRSELSTNTFLSLADLSFWESNFPNKTGANWTAAANAMINEASRYDFEPDNIVGRGVHLDNGRVVLHLGKKLVVDGVLRGNLDLPDSPFTYERRTRLKLKPCELLSKADGRRLIECLDLLPWTTSDMSRVMAGWLAAAPICGILSWKPHLWIIGPAGSGKTWVINEVASRSLGPMAINAKGATTEAGLRQKSGRDALPIIFDEAESQNEKSRERLQAIIDMARQSSSQGGGDVTKGGQNGKHINYKLQSTFLFGSINLGADQAADLSRIITLSLEGPQPHLTVEEKTERSEKFANIKRKFSALIRDDFSGRLFARSLKLAKTIKANAEMLAAVISENADNQRVSDTVALPMAGWFSLQSEQLLTREAARELVTKHTWALDVAARNGAEADHDKAVAHILDQKVRVSHVREDTVAGLVWHASALNGKEPVDLDAYRALLNIGIKVQPGVAEPGYGEVLFASSNAELAKYFEKTAWARSWASAMGQHPRCTKIGPQRFGKSTARALMFSIPDIGIGDGALTSFR